MSSSVGLLEFYILEAGEYVDRLDALLGASTAPESEPLITTARALRGSSTMARMPRIAELAMCLERMGRATRDGSISWDPGVRASAVAAVDDLRILLRAVREWSGAEEHRARARIAELQTLLPPDTRGSRASPGAATPTFFATEIDAIAQALEAHLASPNDRRSLEAAVVRARALRGIASLKELPPLADVCDAIDRAAATRGAASAHAALFQAAARLMRASARDLRATGRTDPDAPEVRRFVEVTTSAAPPDDAPIVPIASLFYADGTPGLLTRASTPALTAERRFRRDIVTYAEHLRRLIADARGALDAVARDRAVRDLRGGMRDVQAAAASFGASDVAEFFGEAAGESESLDPILLDALDSAGALLADPDAPFVDIDRRLVELRRGRALDSAIGRGLGSLAPGSKAATPAASPRAVTPPPARAVTPPAVPTAPAQPGRRPRQTPRRPMLTPTGHELSQFLDHGIAGFEDLDRQPLSEPASLDDAAIVPIDSLLYRGRAALLRALELRDEMRTRGRSDDSLSELFDLLDLAAAE